MRWLGCLIGLAVLSSADPVRADCPSLDAILRRAESYAGLDTSPRWQARSRWAALVPVVVARGTTDLAWDESRPGGRVATDPVEHQQGFDLRLSWRLERLVFDPDQPRLAEAERRARRERIGLRQEVSTAYYRWLRARSSTAADAGLAAGEAMAQLDAYTGGWLAPRCRP